MIIHFLNILFVFTIFQFDLTSIYLVMLLLDVRNPHLSIYRLCNVVRLWLESEGCASSFKGNHLEVEY